MKNTIDLQTENGYYACTISRDDWKRHVEGLDLTAAKKKKLLESENIQEISKSYLNRFKAR